MRWLRARSPLALNTVSEGKWLTPVPKGSRLIDGDTREKAGTRGLGYQRSVTAAILLPSPYDAYNQSQHKDLFRKLPSSNSTVTRFTTARAS